jgi:2-oxoglutarate ferredoxin oxidoreductase subunit gamma
MTATSEREILITGFGGQGIVLTGNILGKAAALHDGKHATMTQSYGPEARGGSCSSQVIISESEILFPYVEHPSILISMSQEGYDKNKHLLGPGGLMIWDADLVNVHDLDPAWVCYHIPATRFAEQLGNKMMANIVMLGFLAAVCDAVTTPSLKQAVLSSVPGKTRENNDRAFERGREYGEEIIKSRARRQETP